MEKRGWEMLDHQTPVQKQYKEDCRQESVFCQVSFKSSFAIFVKDEGVRSSKEYPLFKLYAFLCRNQDYCLFLMRPNYPVNRADDNTSTISCFRFPSLRSGSFHHIRITQKRLENSPTCGSISVTCSYFVYNSDDDWRNLNPRVQSFSVKWTYRARKLPLRPHL